MFCEARAVVGGAVEDHGGDRVCECDLFSEFVYILDAGGCAGVVGAIGSVSGGCVGAGGAVVVRVCAGGVDFRGVDGFVRLHGEFGAGVVGDCDLFRAAVFEGGGGFDGWDAEGSAGGLVVRVPAGEFADDDVAAADFGEIGGVVDA